MSAAPGACATFLAGLERGESKPNAPPLPVPLLLRQEERDEAPPAGISQRNWSGVGIGKLRAGGRASRQTGGLTHPSTGAATQCPCKEKPWGMNQALDCVSIPPLAGFRRFVNVTDLRLPIRSRPSGPASVASISKPSIEYLRSTSVVRP